MQNVSVLIKSGHGLVHCTVSMNLVKTTVCGKGQLFCSDAGDYPSNEPSGKTCTAKTVLSFKHFCYKIFLFWRGGDWFIKRDH